MVSFFRRRDPKKGESNDEAAEESGNSLSNQDPNRNVKSVSTTDINSTSSSQTDKKSSSIRRRRNQGKVTEEGSLKSSTPSYFKVTIPSNANPGNKFQVYVGNRIVNGE